MLGFKVHFIWYPIGPPELLQSFFSTVAYHLEHRQWGSRFPAIMKELYSGKLAPENVDQAIAELTTIQEELKNLQPNQVIWDFNDLTAPPVFGKYANKNAINLSDFYLNEDGRNLVSVFFSALEEVKSFQNELNISAPVRIGRLFQNFDDERN